MQETIIKPSRQLKFRSYFILLALFFSTASVFDYRFKNQPATDFLEFFAFITISVLLFVYFIFSLAISMKLYESNIEYYLFNVKFANSALNKVKVIKNRFALYMLKSNDVMYVSFGVFFFTLTDSWENFRILKSQLAHS